MTPGPTQVDPDVLLTMSMPVLNHVSSDFDSIHAETLSMLGRVFNTKGEIIVLPGSGTSAMELALRAGIKPGSTVLVLKAGFFGDYLARGVEGIGGKPIIEASDVGYGFTPKEVDELLDKHRDVDAIVLQHVETSTSVANPIKDIARVAGKHGVTLIVDGVASVGGMELDVDGWGVDVVFTGSQKALAAPPGLGIVAFRSGFTPTTSNNSLYFDVDRLLREMKSTKNYFITPATNMIYALNKSLKLILEEGLDNRFRRHKILAEAVRSSLKALDIELVAKEGFQADTVTAAYIPKGIEWPRLYAEMRARGIEIAGGLGGLKGKIFRIGHMGQADQNDVIATIAALERSLQKLGWKISLGEGLKTLQEVFSKHNV